MNKNNRRLVIAGNWKMNKNPKNTKDLIDEIIPKVKDAKCLVVICVPFVDLEIAIDCARNSNIKIGAQNCHWEKSGAFTGEISADMLSSMGVNYVIIGHSERRIYFGETDDTVNKRIKAAINSGLNAIVCVGESLKDRKNGITNEVISIQIKNALNSILKEDISKIIIAYEPIWAIGTGKVATASEANEVCKFIRSVISNLYDDEISNSVIIQYGGSMNAKNCYEILKELDIDGGLIGGASLKSTDFCEIVNFSSK